MDEPEVVSTKVSEVLRHAEDLDKLSALKSEIARKKAHVDAQLKASVQQQLEIMETGIGAISRGQKTLNSVKEEMMRIAKYGADNENMIPDFQLILKISKIHRNFVAAEEIKSNLQNLDLDLGRLNNMLRQDESDELTADMPNLLPIHHRLTELQDFRDDVMNQATEADDDVRKTLEDYFATMDHTLETFDERVGLIAMSLIDIVRSGNLSLVVRLAKIVEAEERNDEKILALKEAEESNPELAAKFKSIAAAHKQPRGYKERFLTCIKAAVEAKFENAKCNFEDDPASLPESLDWYFQDLATVKRDFQSLFPPKWKIIDVYLNIYHQMMHDFLKEFIDGEDLDGEGLLTIIQWTAEYAKGMKSIGIKADTLKPHVVDNREAELLQEYTTLIVKKMEEWISNIIQVENREFVERPELQEQEGKLHMNHVTDMFTMINQQLQIALDSSKASVVAGVVEETVRVLKSRQNQWEDLVKEEVRKHTSAVTQGSDELPEGLFEYLIAVANDQIRCVTFIGGICDKTAGALSKKYGAQVQAAFDDCLDGYIDLATSVLSQIVEMIFTDIKPALKTIFTVEWYNGKGEMDTIIATFRSYVVDLEAGLDEELFPAIMLQLLERTCTSYLDAVNNKGVKFRLPDALNAMRADVTTVFTYFVEYVDKNEIKEVWGAVEYLMNLISVSKEELPQVHENFKQQFWDLPWSWVETVLRAREDKSRDMIEFVKSKNSYTPRGAEPTMMNRLQHSGGGGRWGDILNIGD